MKTVHITQSIAYAIILLVLGVAIINISSAQVRSSGNYTIQSDSINAGGGFSSSTNYIQESTVGEIATGPSDSANYSLRAGYQQMQEVYLSMTAIADVVMSPELPGLTGGTSNGSTTFTVITDSPSGYQLSIEAEDDPAMQSVGGETIADYTAGAEPDFSFLFGSSDSFFGYSPEGVDIADAFLDDGGICGNGGSLDTPLACWDGLSTSTQVFVAGGGANHPTGATTTLSFRVGIGGSAGVVAGVYIATTTVTALPL